MKQDAINDFGPTGRGRGTGTGVAGRGRGIVTTVARRRRGRERGTCVAATTTDVPCATGGVKRPRMVGMGILHTQSDFTIHNHVMPMNSSIVTGNLGHHKPRSRLKWKGKDVVTQQGLQEMRENKRRTRPNADDVGYGDCFSLIFELFLKQLCSYDYFRLIFYLFF
uniref:Uncharacterized protein n=1 Tax=Solanum lycopersicum TaxID=4081 RepID=A0A3Q7FLA6_SOLLC|nr:uncharacterized protein LOC104646303 [Solanum lycopersicum]